MRGGEKVLRALAELWPEAPIYTLVADPSKLDGLLATRDIRTSFLQRIPNARTAYRSLLPLLPAAARSLDCRDFDVVICSDAAVIKGVRSSPAALKLCYCHSPMRYVWDLQSAYMNALGPIKRLALSCVAGPVRRWDRAAADTVTAFIANSFHVADRIRRHYGRNAVVIHPPVDVPDTPDFASPDDYYLVLGQLTGYKRADLAIEACNRLRRRLVVIGEGEEFGRLEQLAGPTIELLGWQDDAVTQTYLRRCRALLFCGQEDFGIVPVEAQAVGRPVIAYGLGGAAETVIDGQTGVTFSAQTPDAVVDAIRRFEQDEDQFSPDACTAHARRFSHPAFVRRFRRFFDHCLDVFDRGGPDAVRKEVERMAPDEFLV